MFPLWVCKLIRLELNTSAEHESLCFFDFCLVHLYKNSASPRYLSASLKVDFLA